MTHYEKIRQGFPKLTGREANALAGMIERADSHESIDRALDFANGLLGGHGVEPLRGHAWKKGYYGDIEALYVNMGDPYIPTLIYDVDEGTFVVGQWGDLVEKYPDRFV